MSEPEGRVYVTRDDAILAEVVAAIEAGGVASRDEYDVEAIAAEVLGTVGDGTTSYRWLVVVSEVEFWASVERHQLA